MTTDPSTYVVSYNLVIGLLLVLASERIASFVPKVCKGRFERYARVTVTAFGGVVACLSAGILLFVHILRIGV